MVRVRREDEVGGRDAVERDEPATVGRSTRGRAGSRSRALGDAPERGFEGGEGGCQRRRSSRVASAEEGHVEVAVLEALGPRGDEARGAVDLGRPPNDEGDPRVVLEDLGDNRRGRVARDEDVERPRLPEARGDAERSGEEPARGRGVGTSKNLALR